MDMYTNFWNVVMTKNFVRTSTRTDSVLSMTHVTCITREIFRALQQTQAQANHHQPPTTTMQAPQVWVMAGTKSPKSPTAGWYQASHTSLYTGNKVIAATSLKKIYQIMPKPNIMPNARPDKIPSAVSHKPWCAFMQKSTENVAKSPTFCNLIGSRCPRIERRYLDYTGSS